MQKVKQTHKFTFLGSRKKIEAPLLPSAPWDARSAFPWLLHVACCCPPSVIVWTAWGLLQYGKVDIYAEAFRLTVSRRRFFPPLIQSFHSYWGGKRHAGSDSGSRVEQVRLFPASFVSHAAHRSAAPVLSIRSGTMLHLSLAPECVPAMATPPRRALIGWGGSSSWGQRCVLVSSSVQKNTAGRTSDVRTEDDN